MAGRPGGVTPAPAALYRLYLEWRLCVCGSRSVVDGARERRLDCDLDCTEVKHTEHS